VGDAVPDEQRCLHGQRVSPVTGLLSTLPTLRTPPRCSRADWTDWLRVLRRPAPKLYRRLRAEASRATRINRTEGRSGRCETTRRRAVEKSSTLFVGLDVHKDKYRYCHCRPWSGRLGACSSLRRLTRLRLRPTSDTLAL
jgi:hypothetical protein